MYYWPNLKSVALPVPELTAQFMKFGTGCQGGEPQSWGRGAVGSRDGTVQRALVSSYKWKQATGRGGFVLCPLACKLLRMQAPVSVVLFV